MTPSTSAYRPSQGEAGAARSHRGRRSRLLGPKDRAQRLGHRNPDLNWRAVPVTGACRPADAKSQALGHRGASLSFSALNAATRRGASVRRLLRRQFAAPACDTAKHVEPRDGPVEIASTRFERNATPGVRQPLAGTRTTDAVASERVQEEGVMRGIHIGDAERASSLPWTAGVAGMRAALVRQWSLATALGATV
jgi:hypothetical protein